jgi:chromate transporter
MSGCITAVQLGWNVSRSVPSLPLGLAIFAAGLAALYLWKSKLNVPAVVLGSAVAGGLAFAGG